MYDKYGLALPIYRQVPEYNRNGVPISAQTLNGWINRFSAEYLGPVYDRLKEMMADIPYRQCDETTVQIIRDAYSAYRNFEKESDAKICGCFMHAGRRFVEAFLVAHLKDMSEEQIKEHPDVMAQVLQRCRLCSYANTEKRNY